MFPLWLAPVQVAVLTIAERHADYASKVAEKLRSEGIRAELNLANEKIGHKIREATIRKIHYSVIIGDKEVAESGLSVRKRSGEDLGPMTVEGFLELIKEVIKLRR